MNFNAIISTASFITVQFPIYFKLCSPHLERLTSLCERDTLYPIWRVVAQINLVTGFAQPAAIVTAVRVRQLEQLRLKLWIGCVPPCVAVRVCVENTPLSPIQFGSEL